MSLIEFFLETIGKVLIILYRNVFKVLPEILVTLFLAADTLPHTRISLNLLHKNTNLTKIYIVSPIVTPS